MRKRAFVRKIGASSFAILIVAIFSARIALAFGSDSNVPEEEQQKCSPKQFMAWIYTVGTCVSLEFIDKIFEPHIKPSATSSIFQNISGSSELDKVCLKCHVRLKQQKY